MSLTVRPIELATANAFIARQHRHHRPIGFQRFSLGAFADGDLVGVLVAARPVARLIHPLQVIEVARLATDGTRNACSLLYGASARAAKAMGYERIQTYTLPSEGGASLRAAGWNLDGEYGGGTWERVKRPRRGNRHSDNVVKWRWSRELNTYGEYPDLPTEAIDPRQRALL